VLKTATLPKIAFIASEAPEAVAAAAMLRGLYGTTAPEEADVAVALGGDGLMLSALHAFLNTGLPIYGMNRGSVGFLMNEFRLDGLPERLAAAKAEVIHPLRMTVETVDGEAFSAPAVNEVSLFRQSVQAAKLRLSIDGQVRL